MSDLKPGQKFATPTPGFGDRVFYETLYRQRPDSAMAQEWCVHYGVLPEDEAERVNQMIMHRKGKKGTVSSPVPASKKPSSKKVKLEKDIAVKADLQISGAERVGSSTML